MAEAERLGKHQSEREAVNAALAEYVARRKRRRILEIFRNVRWDERYD